MRLPRDAFVDGDVVVRGPGRFEIGRALAVSGVPIRTHLVTGPRGILRIGDGVRISHGVSLAAHADVTIGDGAVIGPMCIVMDVDFHDAKDPDKAGTPRPVHIGAGVRLGAGVVVLRGATIGDGACIAPHSVVSRAVPPGARAEGVPARAQPPESGPRDRGA